MARIMAIDYGGKRTGIAVTDPLQIIANALTTIESKELIPFLKNYVLKEEVELIIVGLPKNLDDSETHGTAGALAAIEKIKKAFPHIRVIDADERYTSKLAKDAMLQMGLKKKDRRDKSTVDRIAATIMLQDYLVSKQG